MQICLVGAELFCAVGRQTDRQTDKYDEANSRFSQFCERTLKARRLQPRFYVYYIERDLFTTCFGRHRPPPSNTEYIKKTKKRHSTISTISSSNLTDISF